MWWAKANVMTCPPLNNFLNMLQALANNRQTLDTLCGERGRVLELMPQPLRMVLLEAGRDSWLGLSRPSSPWVERNQTPTPDPIGPYTPGRRTSPPALALECAS